MRSRHFTKQFLTSGLLVVAITPLLLGVSTVAALSTTSPASTNSTSTSQQQRLQTVITKGDAEISRRLASLNTLTSKINGAARLSPSDKTALSAEVASTTSGLTTLKAKLDAETTVDGAHADAQDIFTEYRVYALVVPKVGLVRASDSELAAAGKLSALVTKLQARLTTAKQHGKDTTALQATLGNMTTQIASAQTTGSTMQAKVIGLQPSDYNSDHALLTGDAAQLKTAHAALQTARADAKQIIAGLKLL